MPTKSAPKTVATTAVAKPARKGTARTSAGKAAPVATRKMTAKERRAGAAKLSAPTPRRAAPKSAAAKPSARKASAAPSVATDPKTVAAVRKLRAKGTKWADVSEALGIPLGTLARLRKANGGRDGFLG